MEDLRLQLARVFAAELAEHLAALRAGIALAEGGGMPDLRDLFRRAHSLKGAARAADQPGIEDLSHTLEGLLEQAEAQGHFGPAMLADARGLIDAIEDAGDPEGSESADEGALPAADEPGDEIIRISSRHLGELTESLRSLREELDFRSAIASNLRATRDELDSIRRASIAPGARMADISARLARLHFAMLQIAGHRTEADDRVNRAVAAVDADAERLMLVPAESLATGLERMTRELAEEAGKHARLIVEADGAEADRRLIQRLRDPLMQIMRNAIGHGIEAPARRARAGKAEEGLIRLEIRARRGSLIVAVEDDGAGPDPGAIRAAATRRGLVPPDAAAGEAALFALLFEHGVSTSVEADHLSGRGVGLAVVADAVRRLNGSVRLARGARGGTRIEMAAPLTITRRAVLLVEAGGQCFALPTSAVVRLMRLDPATAISLGGRPAYHVEVGGEARAVPIVALAGLLGLEGAPAQEGAPALLIERDGTAVLLMVDALRDVRPLAFGDPAHVAVEMPLILGTASDADGEVMLVLSIDALLARVRSAAGEAGAPVFATPERQRTILVVDDSITTRTLERGILESHGYRVLLSVDGIDALDRLRAPGAEFDLVVADVEMPRMDGFALLAAIRNDRVLAGIPVIMMTSRDAPDDIQRGLDLGADAYVTKQSFEQGELLATVRRLT
ncbi:response regulator [Sphingomonas sp.]|uniref:hybrid sensor histidine kinase/response regulator n=1 Tax=Sphingomonas sp. TaxID=28214 RepID=UPI000DB591AB|nr:response regulator [Sphingomonas sp.]PZU11619.1 MAG: hybrid sensor histidine kinase/response regulator [Sphingomonas sp.]